MRPESRTFEPARFHRTLRNSQMVLLLLMILLWSLLRGMPQLDALLADPMGLAVGLGLLAASVWALSAAKEALRYLGLRYLAGAKPEYLKMGLFWARGGAVYAKCMAAVPARGYRWSALLPCLLLGWLPWGMALACGSLWAYSAASVMAAGTMGDILVLWRLRGLPKGSWVQDSPFAPGCDVYIPES